MIALTDQDFDKMLNAGYGSFEEFSNRLKKFHSKLFDKQSLILKNLSKADRSMLLKHGTEFLIDHSKEMSEEDKSILKECQKRYKDYISAQYLEFRVNEQLKKKAS